jgi:hypothetical protein
MDKKQKISIRGTNTGVKWHEVSPHTTLINFNQFGAGGLVLGLENFGGDDKIE